MKMDFLLFVPKVKYKIKKILTRKYQNLQPTMLKIIILITIIALMFQVNSIKIGHDACGALKKYSIMQ